MQFGPLRNIPGTCEIAGVLSGAGLVGILTVCLSMYGAVAFRGEPDEVFKLKTLSGRELPPDPLQSTDGCVLLCILHGGVASAHVKCCTAMHAGSLPVV